MFEAFAQTMASWVIAVGSILIPPEANTDVGFSNPLLALEGNNIVLSVDIIDWHTEELDRILEAGQTVTIEFDLEVFRPDSAAPHRSYSFNHAVTLDLIDRMYHVNCSEQNLEHETTVENEMRRHVGAIRSLPVVGLEELNGDTTLYFQLRAYLQDINLPGLMRDLDLARLWPKGGLSLTSNAFRRSDFIL